MTRSGLDRAGSRRFTLALIVLWALAWGLLTLPWQLPQSSPRTPDVVWTIVPATGRHVVDAVLNVLLYVPFGMLMHSLGLSMRATVALGFVLSATTETAQLFSAARVTHAADLVFNSAGAALGVVVARRRRSAAAVAGNATPHRRHERE